MSLNYLDCRKHVLDAAKSALNKKTISSKDYLKLRMAFVWIPRKMAEMVNDLVDNANDVPDLFPAGVVPTGPVSELDLTQLLAFIEQLLPLILEFLEAFLKLVDE